MAMVERSRSVSKGPGRRLLIVTLWPTVLRASPATKPVSPVRAPFESPRMSMGCFTALDVILTMRPKRRAIMPSTVALMRRIGVIMFASSALIQVSRSHSRKSPGGGPPALLTRMSGAGPAASRAARPASVVTSPATAVTRAPVASRISFAAASSTSFVRAIMVMFTPSRASDMAHAFPSPRLEAQTIAFRPLIPRSIGPSSTSRPCLHQVRGDWEARSNDRAANRLALRGADGGKWRAHVRGGDAAEEHERLLHAVVHVDERRRVENLHQGVETVVDPPCAVHVPLLARLEQLGLEVGDDAPHSRDRSVGAEQERRHERHREGREHRDGAPGRAQRSEVRLERDDVVRPVLDRADVRDLGESRERLGAVADPGGWRGLEDDDRQVSPRRDLREGAQDHLRPLLGAPHAEGRRKDEDPRRPLGFGVARERDGLLCAVGVDTGDDRAPAADLVERDREGARALLARERGDLGGVAVGNDPGDAAGVGEPTEVAPVGRLVDREVGRERQEVRGHDPSELHHLDTSSVISLAGTTRPYARPMISRVARWISGQSVATPSSTTVTRYSRLKAPMTVARTQMSVIVPVMTSDVTERARRAPSSGVPAKPSYQRLRTTSSPGPGRSSSTVSALGVPSRHAEEGIPNPVGAPCGAA